MHSEAEIRKQVETRLRRWGLLVLNGILFVGVVKLIFIFNQYFTDYSASWDVVVLVMMAWLILLGLHTLRTIYVELREALVRRAVDRERQHFENREKPKHDDDAPLRLSDDGELIDFTDDAEQNMKKTGKYDG